MERDAREFHVHIPIEHVEEFLEQVRKLEGEALIQRDRLVTPWIQSREELIRKIGYARQNIDNAQVLDGFSRLKDAALDFVFRMAPHRDGEDVSEFVALTFDSDFPSKILSVFEEGLEEIEREYGGKPWMAVGLIRPIHAFFDYFGLAGQPPAKNRTAFEKQNGRDSLSNALGWLDGCFLSEVF